MIPGRVIRSASTGNKAGAGYNTLTWNDDFILASTYQDSAPATGTRATEPNNYCDIHIKNFSTSSDTYTFTEVSGFKGYTKCTHIMTIPK